MSNVPQDVMENKTLEWGEAVRISDIPEVNEAIQYLVDNPNEDNAACLIQEIAAQLRAQRSNAEPVGEMVELQVDHDNYAVEVKLFKALPAGTKLYTATPDYDAGVAAGMRKAAELAYGLLRNRLLDKSAESVRSTILSAIPADSQAALLDYIRPLIEAADSVCKSLEHPTESVNAAQMWKLREAINSVLEGKS